MSGETLFFIAATVALAIRALWLSAAHNRHVGWVVAGSWTAGLICLETVDSEWPLMALLAVFGVSEFVAQTGGSSKDKPARWATPILRRLPGDSSGQHRRTTDHDDL